MKSGIDCGEQHEQYQNSELALKFQKCFRVASTIPEASFVLNYHPVLGFKFNCFVSPFIAVILAP
jgi:predicted membrane metal-binding protein